MFEANRRVKAIKLRGAKSEGFWCPLENLSYAGDVSKLKEGDQLDEFNGHAICNKYFTPATQRTGQGKKTRQRDNAMFHKHIDTGMFKREMQLIPVGSLVWVTEKLHGTSQRIGHVLDEVPVKRNSLMQIVARMLNWPSITKEWRHLIGTRNVIVDHRDGEDGFYGAEKFRGDVVNGVSLHRGECVYGEVVGYTESAPIMATQNIGQLKDKRLKELYGDRIDYSYGCLPGTCAFYVYRITQVNEDGLSTELSWNQVKKRCRELGMKTVPELEFFIVEDPERMRRLVGYLTEDEVNGLPHPSTLDTRHIREGVVVRYESEHGTGWLKNKSFAFGCLEGYLKESDEFVDTEESA